jgi:hypothetical protein
MMMMPPAPPPVEPANWQNAAKAKAQSVFDAIKPISGTLLGDVGVDGDDFVTDVKSIASSVTGHSDDLASSIKDNSGLDSPWSITDPAADRTFGVKGLVDDFLGGTNIINLNPLTGSTFTAFNVGIYPKGVPTTNLSDWMWFATADDTDPTTHFGKTFTAMGDFDSFGFGGIGLHTASTDLNLSGMKSSAGVTGTGTLDINEKDSNNVVGKHLHLNGSVYTTHDPTFTFDAFQRQGNLSFDLGGSKDYSGRQTYNGTGSYYVQSGSGETRFSATANYINDPAYTDPISWGGSGGIHFLAENFGADAQVFLSNAANQNSFSAGAHLGGPGIMTFVAVGNDPRGTIYRSATLTTLADRYLLRTTINGMGENQDITESFFATPNPARVFDTTLKNVNVTAGVVVPLSPNMMMMGGYRYVFDSNGHQNNELLHSGAFLQFILTRPSISPNP